MFNGCENLISLDISNFNTLNIAEIEKLQNIFLNCKKLEFINLKNYNQNTQTYLQKNYFQSLPFNSIIYTLNEQLISELKEHQCFNFINNDIDINDINLNEYKKKKSEDNICTDTCLTTNYKYEYEYLCKSECISGTYNNSFHCKKYHSDCVECSNGKDSLCTNCLSCSGKNKIFHLGNCLTQCPDDNKYEFRKKCYEQCPVNYTERKSDEKILKNNLIKKI